MCTFVGKEKQKVVGSVLTVFHTKLTGVFHLACLLHRLLVDFAGECLSFFWILTIIDSAPLVIAKEGVKMTLDFFVWMCWKAIDFLIHKGEKHLIVWLLNNACE